MEKEVRSLLHDSEYMKISQCYNEGETRPPPPRVAPLRRGGSSAARRRNAGEGPRGLTSRRRRRNVRARAAPGIVDPRSRSVYKATLDVIDIAFPGPVPDEERLRVMLVRRPRAVPPPRRGEAARTHSRRARAPRSTASTGASSSAASRA